MVGFSSQPNPLPKILIPDADNLSGLFQPAGRWNLLVETGIALGINLGINLDKPERARKVGNEFVG